MIKEKACKQEKEIEAINSYLSKTYEEHCKNLGSCENFYSPSTPEPKDTKLIFCWGHIYRVRRDNGEFIEEVPHLTNVACNTISIVVSVVTSVIVAILASRLL